MARSNGLYDPVKASIKTKTIDSSSGEPSVAKDDEAFKSYLRFISNKPLGEKQVEGETVSTDTIYVRMPRNSNTITITADTSFTHRGIRYEVTTVMPIPLEMDEIHLECKTIL